MKLIAGSLMLAATLMTATASPQEPLMTAGDLEQLCVGTDHVSENACRIYILGVTQGITVGLAIADHKARGGRPCIPADVSGEELERPLKARLAERLKAVPGDRALPAAELIGAALAHSFPCHGAAHR
ncbi:MAG TPA: Rap1a/Tai family immunity protein [Steroidobacteraceae bacterium]|nr:Rap1a/Tai family immunity protein [Steroidobacteraceae bacterium]